MWNDPRSFLTLTDELFAQSAAWVASEGAATMDALRRGAGLVAWAGWSRFDEREYETFVGDLADQIGVSLVTLKRWRDGLIKDEELPIPAPVEARRAEAIKAAATRKAAAQRQGAIKMTTGSAPIPVESEEITDDPDPAPSAVVTEPPVEPSGPADRGATGDDEDRPATDGEAETTSGIGGGEPADDVDGSSDPAFQPPLNPPEMVDRPERNETRAVPTTPEVAHAVYVAITEAPDGIGKFWDPEQAEEVKAKMTAELENARRVNGGTVKKAAPVRPKGEAARAVLAAVHGSPTPLSSLARREVAPMFKTAKAK